jgi:DNA-binding NtrC family response regulator
MKTPKELNVFVVDDDKLFTTSLTHQLEKMFPVKTNVHCFGTGEECLKHLGRSPDIVLLDYFLSNSSQKAMNGLQVLDRIMKQRPSTKVIMISGQDKIEVAVDTIRHGAYDYIIKNDRAMLRTKLVMTNAAHVIAVNNEVKNYKFWLRMASGFILLLIAACVVIQINFPHTFDRP